MPRYIDADKMIYGIKAARLGTRNLIKINYDKKYSFDEMVETFQDLIASTPAEDVQKVIHGQWITWLYPAHEHVECSVCEAEYYENDLFLGGNEYPLYCPNCGAKMDGEENEK